MQYSHDEIFVIRIFCPFNVVVQFVDVLRYDLFPANLDLLQNVEAAQTHVQDGGCNLISNLSAKCWI